MYNVWKLTNIRLVHPYLKEGLQKCVETEKVCDGVEDCSNGLDEKDCFILAPSLSLRQIDHKTASDAGYLSIFSHNLTTFLPITIDHDISDDSLMNMAALRACEGVRDSSPSSQFSSIPGGYKVRFKFGSKGVIENNNY